MVKPASGSPPPRLRRPPPLESAASDRFKGVRRRSWGRWVSEIRIPHSRDKIWLGSYGSAEQAARAYDIASLLLRGPSCSDYLNFADSSSVVVSAHPQLAALAAAGMPPSPHTIQATAAAAASACSLPATADAADANSADNIDADELDHGSSSSQEHSCCSDSGRAGSCWIQDVMSLILSPKENSSSPSVAKCPSPRAPIVHHFRASPEWLVQLLFDDFQCPLEGLARDGFTAISAAVTTHKRFDTETAGSACDIDATELWSYVC